MSRHDLQVRLNPPCIVLFCLGLVVGLQYASGQIALGGDAVLLLVYMQLCISTLVVAQLQGDAPEWPEVLALALLLAALVSALLALTQALGVWTESGWILGQTGFRRPGANIGQANQLGTLLVMGAASLLYLHQRWHIGSILVMALSFSLMVGMGISESRTGLLSGLLLCLWWFGRRQVFVSTVRWSWAVGAALALVIVMWGWPPLITHIQEGGYAPQRVGINFTAGSRLELWRQLWEAVWMKPWLGWGLRGVSTAHNAVLDGYSVSEPLTYAHNIVFDLAVGVGLPLTVVAIIATGVWGWNRVTNVQTTASWYAVGLLIPFVTHCMLEYPFAYAYLLVPAMLAIGMLERSYIPDVGKIIPRNFILGGFISLGALFAWVAVDYVAIEEDFGVARFAALNVGKTAADYKSPHIVLLTQLTAMLAVTRSVPRPAMPQEEIDLMRLAALRFPWAVVQNNYALILALNGNSKESVRQLKVLRAMHGEKVYAGIKVAWQELANTKYPQLSSFPMP